MTRTPRLLVAATAALLAACSVSDDPPRFETALAVVNSTDTAIAGIALREAGTGTAYHEGPFECAAGRQDCRFFYNGPRIDVATDVTFFDSRGVLVGAYRLAGPPGGYASLEVTRRSTGDYLIASLFRSSPELAAMGQAQREARARHFVRNHDSPDGATDYSEEMAAHYAHWLTQDSPTVERFLERLARRLLDFEVAGAEEFRGPSNVAGIVRERAVGAVDAPCTSDLNDLLTVTGAASFGVMGAFPVGGTVMSVASLIAQSACDDTASRLDAIDSRLNELQVSLDGLADGLGELRNFTSQAAINTGEDAFQSLAEEVDRIASTVRVLKQNYRVASLREYVAVAAARSGDTTRTPLRAALEFERNAGPLTEVLRSLRPAGLTGGREINPMGGLLLQQFVALLRDGALDTMIGAVRLQCDNPPFGDIVALRVNCNLFLGTSLARLAGSHRMASELAAEVYDMLDAYKATDPDIVAQNNYVLDRSAVDYRAALKAAFVAQQAKLVGRYRAAITGNPDPAQTGMYTVLREVDDVVVRLRSANCMDERLGAVAVAAWVRSASGEYLGTYCRDSSTPVPARYYVVLNRVAVNSRTEVCNVLGVPVPCGRLDAPAALPDARSTWYFESLPLAIALSGYSARPGYFGVHANFDRRRVSLVVPGGPVPTTGNGLRLLAAPRGFADRGIANIGLSVPVQHFAGNARTGYVPGTVGSWLRFTRPNGESVVFALSASSDLTPSPDTPSGLRFVTNVYLACVTADCTPGDGLNPGRPTPGPQRFGLDFIDGPAGLTLGDYGWTVTSPDYVVPQDPRGFLSLADYAESRPLAGFFHKRDGRFVPIYPR